MTQAFNLSQLANNLNTSGQLDATDGLSGTLPVANGGTGRSTLTANNVLLGNGTTQVQQVAPGTSGNLLTSNGTTWQSTTPPVTGVGVGQSYVNYTIGVDRVSGTTYTNSTGKPIFVSSWGVTAGAGNAGLQGYVNGIQVAACVPYANSANYGGGVSFVVPAGSTYSVNWGGSSGDLTGWVELR
jgi:hypothetical protein